MADVKWIKLSTQMFDDEKIRLIEGMPEADSILIIWIKLLSQAGKTNASGYIFLNETIPYNDEMLATIFNRPLNVVRLALSTFKQFGMIEIDDSNFLSISNWEKHQNVEGLDKIREDTKKRVQKYREKKKELPIGNAFGNVTVTHGNDIELELELEEEVDKEKETIPYVEIVTYLNDVAKTNYRSSTNKTKELIKARWNEKFRLDDFKKVIDIKNNEWKDDDHWSKFIRPDTLFGTKFEGYLNQKGATKNVGNKGSYQEYDFERAKELDF